MFKCWLKEAGPRAVELWGKPWVWLQDTNWEEVGGQTRVRSRPQLPRVVPRAHPMVVLKEGR